MAALPLAAVLFFLATAKRGKLFKKFIDRLHCSNCAFALAAVLFFLATAKRGYLKGDPKKNGKQDKATPKGSRADLSRY